jgi:hypothetical protein
MYLRKAFWVFAFFGVGIMALLTLPDELLQDVVERTLPEGFESFSLSQKRIYNIAQEYIPRHNRLRRRYKHFRSVLCRVECQSRTCADILRHKIRYDDNIKCALHLLYRIAIEPTIAEYIEHVNLQKRKNDQFEEWTDLVNDHEAVEQITTFVQKVEETSSGEPVQRKRLLETILENYSMNDFHHPV